MGSDIVWQEKVTVEKLSLFLVIPRSSTHSKMTIIPISCSQKRCLSHFFNSRCFRNLFIRHVSWQGCRKRAKNTEIEEKLQSSWCHRSSILAFIPLKRQCKRRWKMSRMVPDCNVIVRKYGQTHIGIFLIHFYNFPCFSCWKYWKIKTKILSKTA